MYIFCREWTTDPRICPPPLKWQKWRHKSGVRILAVTPHANQTGIEGVEDGYVNYESEQLEEQFYRLEREINREHIPISLVRGMEIMSIGPLEKKNQREKADTAP